MERTIVNPVFHDVVTFVKTSEETHGEYSELEVVLGAGGGNPLHRHTEFAETFIAVQGELGLVVGKTTIFLKPGDEVTVPRGTVHRFFNRNDNAIKFRLLFTPGHTGAENMLRILYGLARDGKTNRKGLPNLMTIALVGEIGDSNLPGIFSWIAPILKRLAARARRKGLEQLLLEKYCSGEIAEPAPTIL